MVMCVDHISGKVATLMKRWQLRYRRRPHPAVGFLLRRPAWTAQELWQATTVQASAAARLAPRRQAGKGHSDWGQNREMGLAISAFCHAALKRSSNFAASALVRLAGAEGVESLAVQHLCHDFGEDSLPAQHQVARPSWLM